MTLVLTLLAAFLAIAAVIPHLRKAHGAVRVFDFPRQQMAALALALLGWSLVFGGEGSVDRVAQLAFAAVIVAHGVFISQFTPLWKRETLDFDPARDGDAVRLTIVTTNVKQSNRDHGQLRSVLESEKPDILIAVEVDEGWLDALKPELDGFAHVVAHPLDNSYGMVVASRLPLRSSTVRYLLTERVPSISALVDAGNGRMVRLHALHPEPPVLNNGTHNRDGEIALVALAVRKETHPVIVAGDLNDVAWSRTTRRFRQISRLLDPRIGRGFYNTFDARFPLLRWPLDHLFHSPHFRLVSIERLPACGSDHFPMKFVLALTTVERSESEPDPASDDDYLEAGEVIAAARADDRPPVGEDWEK